MPLCLVELSGAIGFFFKDLDARGGQFVPSFAGNIGVGVDDGEVDLGDASRDDGFGAWWGAAPGAAGL